MEKTTHKPGLLAFNQEIGKVVTTPVTFHNGSTLVMTSENSAEREKSLKGVSDFQKNFDFIRDEDGIPRYKNIHFAAE